MSVTTKHDETCGENWHVSERIHPSGQNRKGQLSSTLTVQELGQEQNTCQTDLPPTCPLEVRDWRAIFFQMG